MYFPADMNFQYFSILADIETTFPLPKGIEIISAIISFYTIHTHSYISILYYTKIFTTISG